MKTSRMILNTMALCVMFLFAGLSNSHAGWTAKTLVTTTSYSYQCTTATVVGPNGDAVAAWLDETSGKAYAAVRRAGVWGGNKSVCKVSTDGSEEIIAVRVAMGGDGTAIAAVVLSHFVPRPLPSYTVVKAATMPLGSTVWSAAVEVSAQDGARSTALGALGADAAGNALVMWTAAGTVMNANRPAGGTWSSPQAVTGCPSIGDFAMNSHGASVVVWTQAAGTNSTLRLVKRSTTGIWMPPVDVVPLGGTTYSPQAAIDGQGLVALTWMAANGSTYDGWMIREAADGVWNTPIKVNDPSVSVLSPVDVALDAAGDLAVAWAEQNTATSEFRIHGQLNPVNGVGKDRKWPTTDVGYGFVAPPSVAISPDGSLAAVAWIDDGAAAAYAATCTLAQPWSAPKMTGTGLYENVVALACGPGATACSVWPAPTGTEFKIKFNASTFKIVPPLLKIADTGFGRVAVGWATNEDPGFVLEAVALPSTTWETVTNVAVVTNQNISVIMEKESGSSRFFRLKWN